MNNQPNKETQKRFLKSLDHFTQYIDWLEQWVPEGKEFTFVPTTEYHEESLDD